MRSLRLTLGLLAFALLAPVLVLVFLKSPYLRFIKKDQQYYAEFAHACDLVLDKYPLGTNKAVHILGDDASVPRIIREMHPSRITVSTKRVYIMVGVRDFGISWEPQQGAQSNVWALNLYPEGPSKVAYVETKP